MDDASQNNSNDSQTVEPVQTPPQSPPPIQNSKLKLKLLPILIAAIAIFLLLFALPVPKYIGDVHCKPGATCPSNQWVFEKPFVFSFLFPRFFPPKGELVPISPSPIPTPDPTVYPDPIGANWKTKQDGKAGKLSPNLQYLIEQYENGLLDKDPTKWGKEARMPNGVIPEVTKDGKLQIETTVSSLSDETLKKITDAGGEIYFKAPDYLKIALFIAPGQVTSLENISEVEYINEIMPPM